MAGQLLPAAVHPDRRRQGIATALLREGERRLRARGAARLTAIVIDDEPVAMGFWRAAGYTQQERRARSSASRRADPGSTRMRRNVLIVLGIAALAWAVLAIALGSPSLRLLSGSGSSGLDGASPACLPATLEHSAALPGTDVDVSPAPETDTANPTPSQLPGRAGRRDPRRLRRGPRSGATPAACTATRRGTARASCPAPRSTPARGRVHAAIGAGAAVADLLRLPHRHPYSTAGVPPFPNPPAAPADYQSFYTMPGVQAPVLTVTTPDRDPAAGESSRPTARPRPVRAADLHPRRAGSSGSTSSREETAEDLNEQTSKAGER